MGLSCWIQNLLAGSRANARKARSAREDFVQLFLTRLEDRRVLNADFSLVGGDSLLLDNFTQAADENLTIQDTGTEYQFILSEGLWTGTDSGGVAGDGTNTLTVDKSLINNTIQIDDSAGIDVDIAFGTGIETVDFSGLTGSLDIDGAGAISQSVGSTLLVSTFDADAAGVTLDEAANDFGTLTLNISTDATLRDANEILLGPVTTLTGSFQLTAGGAISESAAPGIIATGGDFVLSANGSIGAAGAGALDVQVGGTAKLSATAGDIFITSDQDLTIDHLETAAGQADTVEITTTGAANLTLQVTAAEYVNLETDNIRLSTEDGLLTIQGETLSAGSIVLSNTGASGAVSLDANLQTDGGDIDLQNAPKVTLAGTVTLDTELGDDNDAGNVLFSTATGAAINATTTGAQGLMIDTTTAGGNDGNISLSDIGTGVRLGLLSVLAGDGTITLNDTAGALNLAEVLTDNGDVTFGSFTQLTADTTISTLGGDVNWQNTTVFSDPGGPYNLTIDADGGNVQLGRFTNTDGVVAGTLVNNLIVDTTNGTAGELTLHGDITLAGNFQYTGGTATFLNAANSTLGIDSSISTQGTGLVEILATSGTSDVVMQDGTLITTADGNVTIEATNNVLLSRVVAGGTNTADITAGNIITDNTAAEGAGNENIIADTILLQAVNGIGTGTGVLGEDEDIDIDGETLSATNTASGAIQIFEVDDIAIDQIINTDRVVILDALGSITDATPAVDSLVNIIAGQAALRAGAGIGSGVEGDLADIDTTLDVLAAQTTTGDINIDETNTISLGSVGGLLGLRITAGGDEDDISVTADGTLTLTSPIQNVTGDITLTAENANDLLINANVMTAAPGNITLTGQNVSTGGASPTVEITGGGTIDNTDPRNGPVTGTGIITINASNNSPGGITTIGANSTIRTGGGVIQFTTDDIVIDPTALIEADPANGGVVMIRTATAGREIELGGSLGGPVLNISDAELDAIVADSLRIGRRDLDSANDSGDITFTATFSASPAALPNVQLFSGGNVTQAAGAAFIAGNIGIEADGSVLLGDSANDAITSLAVLAVGDILFNDANSLSVGQIFDDVDDAIPDDGEAGIVGVVSTNGFVDLRAQNGNLTVLDLGVASEISAGGVDGTTNLAISLLAAAANAFININPGANVSSTAGAHRYTADNMDIAGTITAGGQAVNLRNANAGVLIDLGSATDLTANTLELSDAELDNISTGLLAIGRNTGSASGDISITAGINPDNTGTLHLITAGTITDAAGGAIVETNLLIEAAGGAVLDNIAAHDVDTLAAIITGIGADLLFRDLDDLTVGTVDRLTATGPNETLAVATASGITTNGRTLANAGGNVVLVSETLGVAVNDPIITTANDQGRNSGAITIFAFGTGGIAVNAPLTTTGTSIGGNGQGGNISLSTQNGSITITAGNLNAEGGNNAVDGGNIILDANGTNADVVINDEIITNDVIDGTVRGSISITADDSVIIGANFSTAGLGAVTITANDSSNDGDGNGLLTMNAGTILTAENGMVTLETTADLVDNATITVQQIITADGSILIDANGPNADVILQNTITTANGGVTVLADDTVTFEATGMILASGTGNVLVRANENPSDGDGNDELFMADGSVINSGAGTITLRTDGANGGNITLGQVITQNTTTAAVTIVSNSAVVDGGDTGGADIIAFANANSRVNIIATTGVGAGDAIETSAVRFDVQNIGAADINIDNATAGLDVVIERMTTLGGNINFNNASGTGLLTITGTGVTSGDPGASIDGGDITITTAGDLVVNTLISSRAGVGGAFTLTGGATFNTGAAIQLGAGDINLTTGSPDIFINADLEIMNGPAQFLAPRDIIVAAELSSVLNADITLAADNDGDGVGGVLVRNIGQVDASGDLTLSGSDLFNDGLLAQALNASIENGVHIEADLANQPQLLATGTLTLQNQPASATADIVLGGFIGSQPAVIPTILIDPNQNVHLAEDVTIYAVNLTFGDDSTPRQDAVIDDLDLTTPSSLEIFSSGITTFYGRIGDDVLNSPNAAERIDSLTTDAGGQTILLGGFVSTLGDQIYGDNVFLHASTDLVDSTTFTAGGNLNFNGVVRGFDFDPGTPNTLILDDLRLDVAGTTTFAGQVGVNPAAVGVDSTQRIGDGTGPAITILSTGETFFNNEVFTESGILQVEAAGRITFREDVEIGMGDTDSFFLANVTLDSLTIRSGGNLTFGSPTPNADELLIFLGSGLDTSVQSKNITINSQVIDDSLAVLNEDLRLNLNQGDLVINGSVGVANTNRFGDLVIVTANDFTFSPGGLQTIFSESLTQLTGNNNGGDLADTVLNGTIDTSRPEGVTLATTNVVYNADVTTNGGRVLTQAAGNISHSFTSSITTAGGIVVSDAVGAIIMQESPAGTATISTSGAPVVLRAGGDLTVSQILSPGGFVSLSSTGGAIIDAGDEFALGSTDDIQAAQLRLEAAAGIGTAGNVALETAVSNLEASNQAGGIAVFNTGGLVIGGLGSVTVQTLRNDVATPINLPTLSGVSTVSGDITIAASTSMTVNEDVVKTGTGSPGSILLIAMNGDFTVNQTIEAADTVDPNATNIQANNGSVFIITNGNLLARPGTVIQATNGNVELDVSGNATFLGQLITLSNTDIFADVDGAFTLGGNILSGGDIGLRSDANWIALPNTIIQSTNGSIAIGVVGNATFQGFVGAMNGNHIFVDVTGDFTLVNGVVDVPNTQGADLLVQVNGQIVVTADGRVNFGLASGAKVVSGTGIVLQPTPLVPLNLISTPQITTEGQAILSLLVGVPGETNLKIIIDWGDGTPLEIVTVPNGGVVTSIPHTYTGPPDPTNPGANIRIFLAVTTDPHVHFFGNNFSQLDPALRPLQAAPRLAQLSPANGQIGSFLFPIVSNSITLTQFVNTALNPRNFSGDGPLPPASEFLNNAIDSILALGGNFPAGITNLGIVTAAPSFPVPISGFGGVSAFLTEVRPPFFLPGSSAQFLPDRDTNFDQDTEDADFSGGDAEDEGEDEVQVRLRVLSPAGQVLFEYDIDPKYLSNPLPLWQRLTDGRYQIVIVEPGSSIPLVVRDVQLKDHKVIRRFDRTQRGSEDETGRLETPADVLLSEVPLPESLEEQPPAEPADADGVWENWQRPSAARRLSGAAWEREAEAEEDASSASLAGAFTGGLALAAMTLGSSKESDAQMMRFSPRALSPAARLRRRLQK